MENIEQHVKKFIWNGKKAKISMEILQGLKINRGAGLTNMRNKDSALKAQWGYIVQNKEKIAHMADSILRNPIGNLLWDLYLDSKHINQLFRPSFWRDALLEWFKYQQKVPESRTEIMQQVLWFNSNICIKEKPVYHKGWHEAGITRISDIVNENGTFLKYDDIKQKHNRANYLTYAGLMSAIPRDWIRILKQSERKDQESHVASTINKKVAKIYCAITEKVNLLESKLAWYNAQTGEQKTVTEYVKIVQRINAITISVKLRSFQYRLLMNAVTTNIHLKLYKIKQTAQCTFCNYPHETLEHLFFKCPQVNSVWQHLCKQFKIRELTYQKVLSNIIENNPRHPANCVVLIAKFYIYRTRCTNERISNVGCMNYLKDYINTEENIARMKNKLSLHKLKWSEYRDL